MGFSIVTAFRIIMLFRRYGKTFTYSMQQSSFWEANRFSAIQEIPYILWNPESSLPLFQEPSTCPSPKPDQSSPCPLPNHFLKVHLNVILPIYAWVLHVGPFAPVSPPKPCMHLSSPQYVLHAWPISFLLPLCQGRRSFSCCLVGYDAV